MCAIKSLSRFLFFIPVGSMFISGCLPDESLSEIDTLMPSPQISVPLLKSNINLSQILDVEDNGMLLENEDNTYSIFYNSEFSSPPLGDYFQAIPDQHFNENFSAGISAPFYSITSPPITYTGKIELDFSQQQFNEIGCKGGNLNINMYSDYQHEVEVKLTLPEIIQPNGDPVEIEFSLTNYGFANKDFDLNGFTISPEQNELSYELEIIIKGSGNSIDASQQIQLDLGIDNIDFKYIEGEFKEFDIPVEPGLIEIPFLDNVINGKISLNPIIRLHFTNNFGLPALADFSNILVENKETTVALTDKGNGDFFHNNNLIPYRANRTDIPAILDYSVNAENSNIEEAFLEIPKSMQYLLSFAGGSQPGDNHFITDESQILVNVEAEIPLAGNYDIILTDTISIDLSDLDQVEHLKIIMQSENDFPVDANIQVYFLDELGKLMTDAQGNTIKLFETEEKFISAAKIVNEATGETVPEIASPVVATIESEKFEIIRNAANCLITTKLKSKSDDDDKVKLYSFYNIKLALAMQVKATFNN